MVASVVKCVLSPFEVNMNTGDPQGLKLYLQAKSQIDKEYDQIYISFLNVKDVVDHFLTLANKYCQRHLIFMLETSAGPKNIFSQVENIQIADRHYQVHE